MAIDVVLLQHAHFLELGVIRVFEFVSSLRRMSVIVKRLKSSSMEIYVKGAPEVMTDICEKDSCTPSPIRCDYLCSLISQFLPIMRICYRTIRKMASE